MWGTSKMRGGKEEEGESQQKSHDIALQDDEGIRKGLTAQEVEVAAAIKDDPQFDEDFVCFEDDHDGYEVPTGAEDRVSSLDTVHDETDSSIGTPYSSPMSAITGSFNNIRKWTGEVKQMLLDDQQQSENRAKDWIFLPEAKPSLSTVSSVGRSEGSGGVEVVSYSSPFDSDFDVMPTAEELAEKYSNELIEKEKNILQKDAKIIELERASRDTKNILEDCQKELKLKTEAAAGAAEILKLSLEEKNRCIMETSGKLRKVTESYNSSEKGWREHTHTLEKEIRKLRDDLRAKNRSSDEELERLAEKSKREKLKLVDRLKNAKEETTKLKKRFSEKMASSNEELRSLKAEKLQAEVQLQEEMRIVEDKLMLSEQAYETVISENESVKTELERLTEESKLEKLTYEDRLQKAEETIRLKTQFSDEMASSEEELLRSLKAEKVQLEEELQEEVRVFENKLMLSEQAYETVIRENETIKMELERLTEDSKLEKLTYEHRLQEANEETVQLNNNLSEMATSVEELKSLIVEKLQTEEQLREEMRISEDKLMLSEQAYETVISENETIKLELERLTEDSKLEKQTFEELLQKAKEEASRLNNRLSVTESSEEELRSLKAEKLQYEEQLQEEIRILEDKLMLSEQAYETVISENESIKMELKRLTEESKREKLSIEDQLQQTNEEIVWLKDHISEMESSEEALVRSLRAEKLRLEEQLQEEMCVLEDKLMLSEQAYETVISEKETIKTELERLTEESKLDKLILEDLLQKANEETVQLKKHLSEITSSEEELRSLKAEMVQTVEKLQEEMRVLENKLMFSEQAYNSATSEKEAIKTELERRTEESRLERLRYEDGLRKANEETSWLKKHFSEVTASSEEELRFLKAEKGQLEQQLQEEVRALQNKLMFSEQAYESSINEKQAIKTKLERLSEESKLDKLILEDLLQKANAEAVRLNNHLLEMASSEEELRSLKAEKLQMEGQFLEEMRILQDKLMSSQQAYESAIGEKKTIQTELERLTEQSKLETLNLEDQLQKANEEAVQLKNRLSKMASSEEESRSQKAEKLHLEQQLHEKMRVIEDKLMVSEQIRVTSECEKEAIKTELGRLTEQSKLESLSLGDQLQKANEEIVQLKKHFSNETASSEEGLSSLKAEKLQLEQQLQEESRVLQDKLMFSEQAYETTRIEKETIKTELERLTEQLKLERQSLEDRLKKVKEEAVRSKGHFYKKIASSEEELKSLKAEKLQSEEQLQEEIRILEDKLMLSEQACETAMSENEAIKMELETQRKEKQSLEEELNNSLNQEIAGPVETLANESFDANRSGGWFGLFSPHPRPTSPQPPVFDV